MSMQISEMTIDDYDEVVGLWRRCEGVGLSEADSRENIGNYLQRNPGFSFVAREDGRIIGAVLCGHDGRRGFIHHLAVDEPYRRKGVGKALEEKCMARLRSAGITKCHLFIFRDNLDSQEFWEEIGWEKQDDVIAMSKFINNPTT
jgi:putative acetyltransferase